MPFDPSRLGRITNTPAQTSDAYTDDDSILNDPGWEIPARRYYANVEHKYFRSNMDGKRDLFEHYKSDRRWTDANTVSGVTEMLRVKGGWGQGISENDVRDLRTLRQYWGKMPTATERVSEGDFSGAAEAVGENVWRGLWDPVNLVGGLFGKAVSSTVGRVGVGMATDAAISAGANALTQDVDMELKLQKEFEYTQTLLAGGLGAVVSAPGHFLGSYKSDSKINPPKLAAKQAVAFSERADKLGIPKKMGLARDSESVTVDGEVYPRHLDFPEDMPVEDFRMEVSKATKPAGIAFDKTPLEVITGESAVYDPITKRIQLPDDVVPTKENLAAIINEVKTKNVSWRDTLVDATDNETGEKGQILAHKAAKPLQDKVAWAERVKACLSGG